MAFEPMMRPLRLSLALCASLACGGEDPTHARIEVGPDSLDSEFEAELRRWSENWLRVEHPEMPVTFEVPEETEIQQVRRFSLGRPRVNERSAWVTLFGIRPLEQARARFHALEVAFFWVTPRIEGVDPAGLGSLGRTLDEPDRVDSFLRAVLYAGQNGIELEDEGLDFVDGHPARRTHVVWRVVPDTPHERLIEGEAIVIPVRRDAALIAVGRFDPESVDAERAAVFGRIVESIEIGGELGGPDKGVRSTRAPTRSRAEG